MHTHKYERLTSPFWNPSRSIWAAAEMKLVAASLLAALGGNSQPSAGDIRSILESVGAEAEKERIDHLLTEVKGKDIAELIAAGREKFASVPSGGAVAAAPLASSVGGAGRRGAEEGGEGRIRRGYGLQPVRLERQLGVQHFLDQINRNNVALGAMKVSKVGCCVLRLPFHRVTT